MPKSKKWIPILFNNLEITILFISMTLMKFFLLTLTSTGASIRKISDLDLNSYKNIYNWNRQWHI